MQVVGGFFFCLLLHACMVNWAIDVASYLAVHEFEINPLEGDLQETPLARLHILHRELSSQFWTYTCIQTAGNQLKLRFCSCWRLNKRFEKVFAGLMRSCEQKKKNTIPTVQLFASIL